jgi:hypothetical protein
MVYASTTAETLVALENMHILEADPILDHPLAIVEDLCVDPGISTHPGIPH